jgi:hypothetical protein
MATDTPPRTVVTRCQDLSARKVSAFIPATHQYKS